MWSKEFWFGAVERAIKTAAQVMLATLAADKLESLRSVPWEAYLTIIVVAVVSSVLLSVASAPASPAGSASLVADRPEDAARL